MRDGFARGEQLADLGMIDGGRRCPERKEVLARKPIVEALQRLVAIARGDGPRNPCGHVVPPRTLQRAAEVWYQWSARTTRFWTSALKLVCRGLRWTVRTAADVTDKSSKSGRTQPC